MKTTTVLLIAGAIIFLDQLSKYIVRTAGHYTTNTGIAFGLLPNNNLVFLLLTTTIILILGYYAIKYPSLGLALLLGGAIGNLIDRVVLGHVIDFIRIWLWPSFNLADAANTIGVIIIILKNSFKNTRNYFSKKH